MYESLAESKEAIVQRLRTYVNYIDILSLALAYASKDGKERDSFVSDSAPWHEAVQEICERFGEEVPEFKHIFFDTQLGMAPWSEEVDQWRRCLRMAGFITFYLMPLDHDYEMTAHQRQRITGLYQQRLSRYETQMREMAKVFARHLKKNQ